MPFSNEVIGTNGALIRNWMKSENYVAGVSGWPITKDGNAEFNDGTFRGQLVSGAPGTQEVVLNSSTTGDAIDVYDSSGNLVYYVNRFGVAASINPANHISSKMVTGQFQQADTSNNDTNILLLPASTTTQQSTMQISMSPPVGTTANLEILGGSDNGNYPPDIRYNSRNVNGSLVQNDSAGTNNLFHSGSYIGSTSDAFGNAAIAHGCSFTPKFCVFSTWDYASTAPIWWVTLWASGMDATNFRVYIRNGSGNPPPSGTSFGLQAFFIG
jgi:hypothetical protein